VVGYGSGNEGRPLERGTGCAELGGGGISFLFTILGRGTGARECC